MRLLMDVGNSRLKWSWQSSQQLGPMDAVVYDVKNLSNELPLLWQECEPPQQIWIASVAAPAINEMLNRFLTLQWGVTARYIQASNTALGVVNAYAQPHKLGCDRWAAMLAAYSRENKSVMVIDCGSAITIDAIDNQGHHLGGTISPGIRLSTAALDQHTNLHWQLNDNLLSAKVLAGSTAEAIMSGVGHSIIGLIERTNHQLTESGHHPIVYLTGGDAAYISQALPIAHQVVEDLVLQGLAMLADHA